MLCALCKSISVLCAQHATASTWLRLGSRYTNYGIRFIFAQRIYPEISVAVAFPRNFHSTAYSLKTDVPGGKPKPQVDANKKVGDEKKSVPVHEDKKHKPANPRATKQHLQIKGEANEAVMSKKQATAEKKSASKTLVVNHNIASHDLELKTKQVLQWLEKSLEVKVTVKLGPPQPGKQADGGKSVVEHIVKATRDIATMKEAQKTDAIMTFTLIPKVTLAQPGSATTNDHNQKPFTLTELKARRPKTEQPDEPTKK